jgi:adenosylcobinamide kinase / adenosylcobinamide-phosphate guanylyltransferase
MQLRRSRTVTLILGGARSGKSRFAQNLAAELKRVTFIATARPSDAEMRRKIARHRSERPASWETIEAPTELSTAIASRSQKGHIIVIDCLTLYLDNLMRAKRGGATRIEQDLQQFYQEIRVSQSSVIIVSNEVGCGVVPAFRSGRRYGDLLGRLNQEVAEIADRVIFMVAGIPLTVKDTGR